MSDEEFDRMVTDSSIYRQYLAERESIERHRERIEKRLERSVDFETALVDWMLKRRRSWRRERLAKN